MFTIHNSSLCKKHKGCTGNCTCDIAVKLSRERLTKPNWCYLWDVVCSSRMILSSYHVMFQLTLMHQCDESADRNVVEKASVNRDCVCICYMSKTYLILSMLSNTFRHHADLLNNLVLENVSTRNWNFCWVAQSFAV